MASAGRPQLSPATRAYVAAITAAGFSIVALSVYDLSVNHPSPQLAWLALLTLLSGFLPVKLHKVYANISVSETFVFCGTLLFGPSAGALLVLLDVAMIWARLARKEIVWHRMWFSLAANPLCLWVAATALFAVAGTPPLASLPAQLPGVRMTLGLVCFATLYFLLNTTIIALAIAFDQNQSPFQIWSKHFSRLWLNYWAGASVAALFVSVTHTLSLRALFLIMPLMLVLFLTYKWSSERVEKAEKHLKEMKHTFLQTIEALALAIDAKDQVTHGHIRRVQRFTMALASALGIQDENLLDAIRAAALLHDTGKLAVPEYILNKPGPLTSSEFERMKVHAAVGADILKSIDFPYPVEPIVRHHHESWDGSGYPEGIKGQEIPLGARILSVVDCYDALTSDRPYRPRYTRQQAEQVLRERRGVMYDPWVVDEFLKILDKLERTEAAEQQEILTGGSATVPGLIPAQLDVISATTAEEREFNELRRDLPKATSLEAAAETLFRHLRRVVPAASLTLFMRKPDSNELHVVACSGVGSSAIAGLMIPIGERISGWAFANRQIVENSDATLDLGPVAKTFSVPLRYALAVPLIDRDPVGVVTLYSSEPFNKDSQRMVDSAATLFVSAAGSLKSTSNVVPSLEPSVSQSRREGSPASKAEPSPSADVPKPRVH
jgi:putative nucleotidyltransferase with HDIG domain